MLEIYHTYKEKLSKWWLSDLFLGYFGDFWGWEPRLYSEMSDFQNFSALDDFYAFITFYVLDIRNIRCLESFSTLYLAVFGKEGHPKSKCCVLPTAFQTSSPQGLGSLSLLTFQWKFWWTHISRGLESLVGVWLVFWSSCNPPHFPISAANIV